MTKNPLRDLQVPLFNLRLDGVIDRVVAELANSAKQRAANKAALLTASQTPSIPYTPTGIDLKFDDGAVRLFRHLDGGFQYLIAEKPGVDYSGRVRVINQIVSDWVNGRLTPPQKMSLQGRLSGLDAKSLLLLTLLKPSKPSYDDGPTFPNIAEIYSRIGWSGDQKKRVGEPDIGVFDDARSKYPVSPNVLLVATKKELGVGIYSVTLTPISARDDVRYPFTPDSNVRWDKDHPKIDLPLIRNEDPHKRIVPHYSDNRPYLLDELNRRSIAERHPREIDQIIPFMNKEILPRNPFSTLYQKS